MLTSNPPMLFPWRGGPPPGNLKFLSSGGSMVAKLKLKGIDGRAPPGVEPAVQSILATLHGHACNVAATLHGYACNVAV